MTNRGFDVVDRLMASAAAAGERTPLLRPSSGTSNAGVPPLHPSTPSGAGLPASSSASHTTPTHNTASRHNTPRLIPTLPLVVAAPTPDEEDLILSPPLQPAPAPALIEGVPSSLLQLDSNSNSNSTSNSALTTAPSPAAVSIDQDAGIPTPSDTASLLLKRQLTTEHSVHKTSLRMSSSHIFFIIFIIAIFCVVLTCWNLFQDILTNGIVVLPYLFASAGWGAAISLLLLCAALSHFTLLLVRDLMLDHALTSYYEMVHVALGFRGYFVANASAYISPFFLSSFCLVHCNFLMFDVL